VLLPQPFLCAYILDMERDKHTIHIIKKGWDPMMDLAGQQRKKTHTDYARTYSKLLEYLKINRSQSL
jgi:hypothetical protein